MKRGTVNDCIRCRLCDEQNDSVRITLDERRSTRYHVWLCNKKEDGKYLYGALLNGLGEKFCPLSIPIDEAIIAGRRRLVKKGIETRSNREFIEKLINDKNPYE